MFVMPHWANNMISNNSKTGAVWPVDSGASNHMTSHEEWFMNMREHERHYVVETSDDSTHPIEHIGGVCFGNNDNKSYIKDALHVLMITKNLVSFGQIAEQGMQVRSSLGSCFIENNGQSHLGTQKC